MNRTSGTGGSIAEEIAEIVFSHEDMPELLADSLISSANAQKPELVAGCCRSSFQFIVTEMIVHSGKGAMDELEKYKGMIADIDFDELFERVSSRMGISVLRLDGSGGERTLVSRHISNDLIREYVDACAKEGVAPLGLGQLEEECRKAADAREISLSAANGGKTILAARWVPVAEEVASLKAGKSLEESCEDEDASFAPGM